jgi:predicted acyltransferase
MVGMIMVDCKGKDAPWWLRHPSWYGLSPADFVFPSFVFIMGMAVPLALNKNKPFSIKTVLRIIGLFVIGFLINYIDEEFDFEHSKIFIYF